MCGLWGGVSTVLVKKELEIIRDLGILSQFRGRDSTGMSVFTRGRKRKNTQYSTSKSVIDSTGFFFEGEGEDLLSKSSNPAAVIGHCRAATVGDVTQDNAHPYHIDHIIGAHNGTIHSYKTQNKIKDSYALYEQISDWGLKKTLSELALNDAYALTFFDTEHDTLNIIRNSARTLYLMTHGSCVYWASEEVMLEFVARRHSLANYQIIPVDPLVLYQLKLGTATFHKTPMVFALPKPPVVINDNTIDSIPWMQNREKLPAASSNKAKLSVKSDLFPNKFMQVCKESTSPGTCDSPRYLFDKIPANGYPSRIRLFHSSTTTGQATHKILKYRHGNGKYYEPEDMVELLNEGCAISGVIPTLFDDVYWMNDSEFVIESCRQDEVACEYSTLKAGTPVCGKLVYLSIDTLKEKIEELKKKESHSSC